MSERYARHSDADDAGREGGDQHYGDEHDHAEPGPAGHWGGHHHHRHHGPGGRRFRARVPGGPGFRGPGFGGPGFGGPGFGGPEFGGNDEPGFGGPASFRGGPGFEPGFPGGPPGFGAWSRGGRRGGRARRGDVRAAALSLLAEAPMNGYQIIQQIQERSGGLWRASPGSVYPALAQLEDEGLIALAAPASGGRAYELTEQGRAYVAEHDEQLKAQWSAMRSGAAGAAVDMRMLIRQVHLAAFQVVSAGTEEQVAQARKVLTATRRSLYRILAEDDSAPPADGD